MKNLNYAGGAALLVAASGAQAQDVPANPPAQVPEPVQTAPVPPSDPADQETMREFSDEEIAAFAAAAMRMRELRADETLADAEREEHAQMIVAEAGLDEQTYRAIGRAAQADPAVAMRVQQALEALADEPTMQEEEPGQ